jgi:hypothetical protein
MTTRTDASTRTDTPAAKLTLSGATREQLRTMIADAESMRDRYIAGNGSPYYVAQYTETAKWLRGQLGTMTAA